MATPIYASYDFRKVNEILNVRIHNVTTSERSTLGGLLTSENKGVYVYDTTDGQLYIWSGSAWVLVTTGTIVSGVSSVSGTANEISVSPTTGATVVSLPSAITLTGKTVTGGTFNSGAFNGTLGATTPSAAIVTTLETSGSVGLGVSPTSSPNFQDSLNITGGGGGVSNAAQINGVIQSDVTSTGRYLNLLGNTSASSFTLPNLFMGRCAFSSLGAGSAITSAYGWAVDSSFTVATNNYGVRNNMASGTGRYGLYFDGTVQSYHLGNFLFNNQNAQSTFFTTANITPKVQILGTDSATSSVASFRFSNNTAPAFISFSKSRGGSVGTQTIVSSGDEIGKLAWNASDGTNFIPAAWVQGEVEGTPGTNDMPGRLVFYTTPDGSATPTEKLRISNNGFTTLTGSFGRGAPVTKTADFTVASTENWLIVNKSGSTCTVTLPTPSSFTGREIMIKTIQAQTVVSASGNVIPIGGGAAGTAILPATVGAWCTLVSNGTSWEIMQS